MYTFHKNRYRSDTDTARFPILPLNNEEAFIGSMVVDEEFQGRDIGKRLLQRTMTALGDRNISLYASKRGVFFYEKNGFKTNKTFLHQTTFPINRSYLKGVNFQEGYWSNTPT